MTTIETGYGAAAFGETAPEAAEFASLMPAETTLVAATGEDDDFRACRNLLGDAFRDYTLANESLRLAGLYRDLGQDKVSQSHAEVAHRQLTQLSWTLDELLGTCANNGSLSEQEVQRVRDMKDEVDGLLRGFGPSLGERAGAFIEQAGQVMGQIGQGLLWVLGGVLGGLGSLLFRREGAF